ncbi:MAG: hypothetical protein PHU12_02795 [Candidatus Aenigmarchaeota archaeon]|nr:hypothetical protein [Candidatus Aenigmarchaeota archaeon]
MGYPISREEAYLSVEEFGALSEIHQYEKATYMFIDAKSLLVDAKKNNIDIEQGKQVLIAAKESLERKDYCDAYQKSCQFITDYQRKLGVAEQEAHDAIQRLITKSRIVAEEECLSALINDSLNSAERFFDEHQYREAESIAVTAILSIDPDDSEFTKAVRKWGEGILNS